MLSALGCVYILSACGFQPIYGQSSNAARSIFPAIEVGDVTNKAVTDAEQSTIKRSGEQFRSELEDRLNPKGIARAPLYRLAVVLTPSTSAIGVARDGTISRYNVTLTSNFVLYRLSDGKPVYQGSVTRVSSYNNVSNAYFSTFVAEQDAIKRGVTELAEEYRLRLAAWFSQHPDGGKAIVLKEDPFPVLPASPLDNQTLGIGTPRTLGSDKPL